jgi:hypothetical protein
VSDALTHTNNSLLIFIDETGLEDFSDPANPTFGRGGCAVLGGDYVKLIKKPWTRLKREKLGGATKPFHATVFERSRPTLRQISAISAFLRRPFWRFAAMSDGKTQLAPGGDGHRAISLVTINFIRRLVESYATIDDVALVFEASERGDKLVERDFDLAALQLVSALGRRIPVEGYFMPKSSMEPGLEVADLVAHTAGRQRRHQLRGGSGAVKDFQQMFWHSPIPPAFMSIDMVELTELAAEDGEAR